MMELEFQLRVMSFIFHNIWGLAEIPAAQIAAIILSPSFPGWLAPLNFNPSRFGELASFATTLTVSWVLSSLLIGGYRIRATSGVSRHPDNEQCLL